MLGHVYKTTNNITGQIYIGAKSTPPKENLTYLGMGTLLKEDIKIYGKEKFTKQILLEDIDDVNELNELEEHFIKTMKSTIKDGNYNIQRNGGPIVMGHRHTEESRRVISEKLTGAIRTKEHCKNLSIGLKNSVKFQKWMKSAENSERCRLARLGYKHKESTKKKISIGNIGKIPSQRQRHLTSYIKGNQVIFIPPKGHWIKELIIDNSMQLTCQWLGLSFSVLYRNNGNEIFNENLNIAPMANQRMINTAMSTLGWTCIFTKRDVKKNKKRKVEGYVNIGGYPVWQN